MNDLGPFPIAAHDVLCLPSIVVGIGEGPYYVGFYNQMKQEFTSARYLYYEAITTEKIHFSDKGVLLMNTLDYPSYSLSFWQDLPADLIDLKKNPDDPVYPVELKQYNRIHSSL